MYKLYRIYVQYPAKYTSEHNVFFLMISYCLNVKHNPLQEIVICSINDPIKMSKLVPVPHVHHDWSVY